MSSILHLCPNQSLSNPSWLQCSYMCKCECVCMFIAAQYLLAEMKNSTDLSTEKHPQRGSVQIPFGYTTQSTAGPGIVSVHKCHHHKHSQSRHVDAPAGGFAMVQIQFGNCVQENRERRRLQSLYTLNSTEVQFLHSLDPLVHKNR